MQQSTAETMTTSTRSRQTMVALLDLDLVRSRPNGAAQVAISQIASQSARPDHDVTGGDDGGFALEFVVVDEGGVFRWGGEMGVVWNW
ncbi:hypothetical protein Pint_17709 [Pistacia integerrima]|uniref:Uncharacterized protein n=1 Tax=Pistacia integerrima TaxID=434235 RepID=A0ACC0YWF5_9ROSI|nr:hypothetical protein Pint_17709 [Pistacia integerrima]